MTEVGPDGEGTGLPDPDLVRLAGALVVVAGLLPAAPLGGQEAARGGLDLRPSSRAGAAGLPEATGERSCTGADEAGGRALAAAREPTGPAGAFAASLLLPGAGQWLQGQDRSHLYLGLELAAWAAVLHGRFEGTDLRNRYRDLAREAALLAGDATGADDFAYYEALAEHSASGAWDVDPVRPGLQPETDPDTYNGSVWSLAREIYSLDRERPDPDAPAYERALEYYREHGYRPALAWDWSGEPEAADRYRRLIDESDAAFRRATVVLGLVAANHLLSAVDGYLSARIGSERTADRAAASGIRPSAPGFRRWSLELRVPAP